MTDRRVTTSRLTDVPRALGLAARLYVLDRWPTLVAEPWVWDRFAFEQPFDYRWNDTAVPDRAQRSYDRLVRTIETVQGSPPVAEARRLRNRRIAGQAINDGVGLTSVNRGPGGRRGNSFQVALAVDAHLSGSPSTALGWSNKEDPILVVPLDAVTDSLGGVERVVSRAEAEELVQSWGPGAKGIVSLRDPASTFHRLFNATNHAGAVTFLDCSAKREDDPRAAADATLATVDETSPFASIQLWRTKNMPGQSRLPDDLLTRNDVEALGLLDGALPRASASTRERALAKMRFANDVQYGFWLVEQIRNGGATFLPPDLARLASGAPDAQPEPLSQLDSSLVALTSMGQARVWGDRFEVTVPDVPITHRLIATFDGVATRTGSIDGLAPGTVEVSIPADRLRHPAPGAIVGLDDLAALQSIGPIDVGRRFSWIDVNRAVSPGQRKTNCWNCAAAVAEWLRDHTPASGLPVYPSSGFRPTIPEYVELLDPSGETVFVADQAEAERVVRSWGAGSHGLVVASLNVTSTHMFNVVFDGDRVRYLDGYVGREGDFNFDITWERIGVVRLGPLAPSHLADSVTESASRRSPNPAGHDPEDVRPLLAL